MNFMLLAERYLPNTTAIRQLTCGTRKLDLKRQADRSPAASSEQSDAPERRSRPNRPWQITRRRPVIGDVELNRGDLVQTFVARASVSLELSVFRASRFSCVAA